MVAVPGEVALRHLLLIVITGMSLCSAASAENRDWVSVQSWVYQLCNYKDNRLDEMTASPFDLAVIDLSRDGGTDYFTKEEIHAVKTSGKIVLAYFSIGSMEEYRPEWAITPRELMAGKVQGWPGEQYVQFWDERWWPIVKGRVDQALDAGFDGAYLDMVTTYEEIPNSGMDVDERAQRMVGLIARISDYAKCRNPDFRIVPQNCPELFTRTYRDPRTNGKYIHAIDGIGLESVFYLAHDKPADKDWCEENRRNALAIRKAGKLVLGVDYARKPASITHARAQQQAMGFVPYVSIRNLDRISQGHGEAASALKKNAGETEGAR